MAVIRRKSLAVLAFFIVMIFMLGMLFDDEDNLHDQKALPRKLLLRYRVHGNRGGSRVNYNIPEVDKFVKWYLSKQDQLGDKLKLRDNQPYNAFLTNLHSSNPNARRLHLNLAGNSSWERFYTEITQHALYDPYTHDTVEVLLRDLATKQIVSAVENLNYSQATLVITLSDGAVGVFKPKRIKRDHESHPGLLYFSEYERHNAEIAAFHLDRILGFYRAPPTVSRAINVTAYLFAAYGRMVRYISPGIMGNNCFIVRCQQYHDDIYPMCGNPHMIDGSLTIALPGRTYPSSPGTSRHPWARTYNMTTKAPWELNQDYCQLVRSDPRFTRGRLLLDLVDMAIFDYLTGNMDRPIFERFPEFGEDTFLFHVDNAKGFAKSDYDCTSCLAPLRQCCQVRQSTLVKLIKLYQGPDNLSDLLRSSLKSDPMAPILAESHLDAVDRRLGKIIKAVSDCIKSKNKDNNNMDWDGVVINDEN